MEMFLAPDTRVTKHVAWKMRATGRLGSRMMMKAASRVCEIALIGSLTPTPDLHNEGSNVQTLLLPFPDPGCLN